MISRSSSAGIGALEQERLEVLLGDLGPVAEQVDPVGGGRDPFGQHALAEQRVDEARLAGVELAGHDEEEESRELVARLAEAAEVVGLDVGAEARERGGEAVEQLLLAGSGDPAPAPTGSARRPSSLPITIAPPETALLGLLPGERFEPDPQSVAAEHAGVGLDPATADDGHGVAAGASRPPPRGRAGWRARSRDRCR